MIRRALVCEDDRAIRTMVHVLLQREGFDVTACEHGAEAIELLGEPFDVIVLDLMMPQKSGQNVLRLLEQKTPHLLERVIVTTADSAVLRAPLAQPVAATLIKPFDLQEFLDTVHRVAAAS